MTWLVTTGFTNALVACVMAVAALAAGRWLRRPALAHLLWVLVLCKLLTPAFVKVPLGTWFHPPRWLAHFIETQFSDPAGSGRSPNAATPPSKLAQQPHRSSDELADANGDVSGQVSPRAQASLAPTEIYANLATRSVRNDGRGASPWTTAMTPADGLRCLGTIWIAGSLVMIGRLARRYAQFHAYLKLAGRHDERLQDQVAQLARTAQMASVPRVVVVDNVVSPLLWGVGRHARLVFPTMLAGRLDQAARHALLLHELAHHARGDWWVRLLELAVQVLYWWHPLVWWARREIEAAEEECCDAWVLKHLSGTRRSYAEALLAAIDFLCDPPPAALPPAACGLGEVPLLRSRLTQIMCGQVAIQPSRSTKALVLIAAAVVLPLGPSFVIASSRSAFDRTSPPRVAEFRPQSPRQPKEETVLTSPPTGAHVEPVIASAADDLEALDLSVLARVPSAHYATAISPNGKYKLEARVDRKTTLLHEGTGYRLDLSAHKITCASYSPDSRSFATGHDDSIVRVWYCDTGVRFVALKGSEGAITSVAFAPDGRRIAAGTSNGDVHVWDLASGDEVARLVRQQAGVSCVRWSQHGDR
ncbi:MAG TPA: M56 family metallopeptidase, partial [Pirellulales bacterium]|nr:M56 family metallopeptidase [Pirellulales bacterium]